jgi:hypothetical protein
MGIYGDPKLLNWFTTEYGKHSKSKLDMGKSCIRFKKMDEIPLKLIGELSGKITPEQWIEKCVSVTQNRKPVSREEIKAKKLASQKKKV